MSWCVGGKQKKKMWSRGSYAAAMHWDWTAFPLAIPRNSCVYFLKALAVPVAGCVKILSVCHCSKGWHVLRPEKQKCTSNPSSQLGLKGKIPWAGRGDLLPCSVSKKGAEALIKQLLPLSGSASKSMLAPCLCMRTDAAGIRPGNQTAATSASVLAVEGSGLGAPWPWHWLIRVSDSISLAEGGPGEQRFYSQVIPGTWAI